MEKTHKEKLREAGILRYGSEEAWRRAKREQGLSANRTTPRGFARMDKEKVREISRKAANARWHKETTAEENGAEV